MADAALRRAVDLPTAAWLESPAPATRFILRGAAAARAAAGQGFGLSLPETACRATTDGNRAALWLGPDEQLLDVSHRQVGFRIHGPHAEWLLQSQCPLPLNLRDFPAGMCTRTVFGKAEIVLWRPAEQVFRLEVWRSFSLYVVQLLHEVASEL